jgi:predicted ArsR family transcriptional regulator
LGNRDLRAALDFVRSRRQPPTAAELAGAQGISRSVARWRLERLVENGHLRASFAKRRGGPGAGRPAKRYEVVPETEALADRLQEIGEAYGRELAREARLRPAARPRIALERVCDALGRLGFQASVESVGEDRAVLVTPTCPLRPLVVTDPSARDLDQGMWRGLVGEALRAPAFVRCETSDCLAAECPCRVAVVLSA